MSGDGDGDGDGDGGKKAKRSYVVTLLFFWLGFRCSSVFLYCYYARSS